MFNPTKYDSMDELIQNAPQEILDNEKKLMAAVIEWQSHLAKRNYKLLVKDIEGLMDQGSTQSEATGFVMLAQISRMAAAIEFPVTPSYRQEEEEEVDHDESD